MMLGLTIILNSTFNQWRKLYFKEPCFSPHSILKQSVDPRKLPVGEFSSDLIGFTRFHEHFISARHFRIGAIGTESKAFRRFT